MMIVIMPGVIYSQNSPGSTQNDPSVYWGSARTPGCINCSTFISHVHLFTFCIFTLQDLFTSAMSPFKAQSYQTQ